MKLSDALRDTVDRLRAEGERLRDRLGRGGETQALSQLLRPDLGKTPAPLRRVLEPVVAATALVVLASLLGMGAFGFATLALAAALIYLILTKVFGLELSLGTP